VSAPNGPADPVRAVYHEPARTYGTVWALSGLILGGFALDVALGGGFLHVGGWLIALLLVGGISAFATHAARTVRSITVTPTELRVGEHAVPRESIIGCGNQVGPLLPVLGQTVHERLPRGTPGLALHLVGGAVVVVPTRRPALLAAALDRSPDEADVAVEESDGIRPAEPDDLGLLPDIDDRAESLFRVSGLELPEIEFGSDALDAAKAVFVAGRPAVGFVWLAEVDGLAHIEELAVLPGRMRRGLGTALLDAACTWAATAGYRAVTLTTFADVAWNAPFYAARGFVVMDEITPGLAAVRDRERTLGLDAAGRRVVMRRELASWLDRAASSQAD
jgi:ribosomal protein S18 acetylase RimI-like enzyme